MKQQLYCVCVKARTIGKSKTKWRFREPTKEEIIAIDTSETVLKEKLPLWISENIVPTESFPNNDNDTRPLQYGMPQWCDLFNSRQLLTHLTYLEKFLRAQNKLLKDSKTSEDLAFAAAISTYAAMVFDTCINYNCLLTRWAPDRTIIKGAMDIQAFPFRWSYAEWNQPVPKAGYEWALSKVIEALCRNYFTLAKKPRKPYNLQRECCKYSTKRQECSLYSC